MRWVRFALLAALVSGCGAPARSQDSAPPPDKSFGQPLDATGSAASSRAPESASAQQTMWAVRSFEEKPQWLDAHPALAKSAPKAWATEMQLAVTKALDAKGAEAHALPAGVTDAQVKQLFADGLSYLVEGTMSAVRVDAQKKSVTLEVGYRLQRLHNTKPKMVQARGMTATVPATAADEAAMHALIPLVAAKIADAVIADVPADLLAVRG